MSVRHIQNDTKYKIINVKKHLELWSKNNKKGYFFPLSCLSKTSCSSKISKYTFANIAEKGKISAKSAVNTLSPKS